MTKQEMWLQYHRVNNDGVIERICNSCDTWQEESSDNFYLQNKKFPERGYTGYCKPCVSKNSMEWRNKSSDNLEIYRASSRKTNKRPERKAYIKDVQAKYVENGGKQEWDNNNRDKLNGYSKDRSFNKTHEINDIEWEECKKYFNHRCAYCGLAIEEHWQKRKGLWKLHDLHKEHVDHDGNNKLDNCIPSCGKCNSSKRKKEFSDWYNIKNSKFDLIKLHKIQKWLEEDYKKYIK